MRTRLVGFFTLVVLLLPSMAHAAQQTSYYLALGDSLAIGIQPSANGDVPTNQGYADDLYAVLHARAKGLALEKLGCSGETTTSMIEGGICTYAQGSQLAAALAFLQTHTVSLVTIDIGANDLEDCGNQPSLTRLASCIGQLPKATANVAAILASLRAAAGPGVRIAGMNYYLPALAEWRSGLLGRATAQLSEKFAVAYDDLLKRAYGQAGITVANVFEAFETTNFGDPVTVPGIGSVPRNVARICQWTWECAPPPRGPNQHANAAGYRVIADAILAATKLS